MNVDDDRSGLRSNATYVEVKKNIYIFEDPGQPQNQHG
jgi:hypothetical protein